MQRYVTALLVAFTLCAAQYAYSLTIVPLTTAGAPIARPRRSSNADYIPASFIEAAERYFPDTEWIEHAKWQWQGASEDDAVLYFQNITRDPAQGELVKVSPLAVLWKDPDRPDAPPYRLMADSALIEFENPISEDAAIDLTFKVKPGRIVGAFLDGAVSIDGPDGLLIAGRTFVFSEVDGTLYSDEAVRFQYGPTDENSMRLVGSAVQLAMSLIKTDEPVLGEDMPHIGGLAQLRLRSQVKIDADFELDDTPQHAQITSEGPFEYDATKREATFSKAVNVTRVNDPQGKPLTDTLECEWLGIYFDDLNGSPDEGKPEALGLFDGLRFRRLRAMGSTELFGGQFSRRGRAKLSSEEHGVSAVTQDLRYDAVLREANLIDEQHLVEVTRGSAELHCPQVRLRHGEGSELEFLECRGAGRMLYRDPKLGQHPAEVKWSGRVLAEPDPDRGVHRIRLEDGAQLLLPDTAALAANLLTLWLDLEAAQNPGEDGELLHRPLPLKQALAEGEVRFLSHDVAVDRANRIDVQLELGTLAETSQDSQNGLTSSANEGSEPHDPFRVGCDELTLNLIHDPVIAKIDLQEVHGNGHVRLQYNPEKSTSVGQVDVDGPLVLTGIQLHAVNQGENRQKLTLSGETGEYGEVKVPASMEFGGASILGAELVVEREQNIMRVNGPGKFIVPISEDLEGNALQSPTDMEVVWSEGMVFDGQQANFFGSCKASLADGNTISRLNCEKLTVVLNERISFTDPESQPKDLQLAQFTAEHHVRLEIREFEGIHVVGLRIAELARFTLNQISGDFEGRDGYLDNWTRGDLVRFTSTPEAQANQPAKIASPKWRFTHVEFKGQLIGNMGRREAELHDDVVLVSAPVSNAMVKFDIDDQLGEDTEQAANAVSLKCQVLRIVQQEVGNVYYSTITATGKSTTLEGQSFQANADELIFDERLGRFTLRGIGRDVTLFFQRSAMEPWTPSRHRVIMFTPATKAISFGGSSGISGQF